MTPEQLSDRIMELVEAGKSEEAKELANSTMASFTAQQLRDFNGTDAYSTVVGIRDWFVAGTTVGDRWRSVNSGPDLEDRAFELLSSGTPRSSNDLDGDGRADPSEDAAFAKATERLAGEIEEESNLTADDARREAQNRADSLTSAPPVPIPDSIMSLIGRREPTTQELSAMISSWNQFNPDTPISTKEELYARMANGSNPMVGHVLESSLLGTDPIVDYRIKTASGREVTIQSDEFAAARKYFQEDFGAKELTTLVRLADRLGVGDGTGRVAWQPLAALARAIGVGRVGDDDSVYARSPNAQGPKLPDNEFGPLSSTPVFYNKLSQAALKYKYALAQYGNVGIAYLAALDPELANKLATSDYKSWSQADIRLANQYLVNGGVVNENTNLGSMGYATETSDTLSFLGTSKNGLDRTADGSGAERQMPDPKAIRQAAKDMYKQLFMADPTEEQLDSFVSQVQGTMAGAPDNQTIDAGAQLRDLLESDRAYKEMYGRMPGGMSEAEYQAQFRAGAQTMLGQEAADPNTIRSGMRSGEYQTTIGAIAGSAKSRNNSTFMGRLAQAAQLVSENT